MNRYKMEGKGDREELERGQGLNRLKREGKGEGVG
jgi:hypothetical protein